LVEHLHGKEGVDGSSPSEGSIWNHEVAAKGGFFVAVVDTADHLLVKEGIDDNDNPAGGAKLARIQEIGKLRHRMRASPESWGQVLGTLADVMDRSRLAC
jgi:hypothetical protein